MIMTTRTVDVPSQREVDDRTDAGELRNSVRAEYGRAAVEVGSPDYGMNDSLTDAIDAIANILHWACDFNDAERALSILDSAFDHWSEEAQS